MDVAFTYLLGWSKHRKWYYGVYYRKGAKSSDIWNKYKTSSKYVHRFVEAHGDPDIIRIKSFDTKEKAIAHELKLLKRVKAHINDAFINKAVGRAQLVGRKQTDETKALLSQRWEERKAAGFKMNPWPASRPRTHSPEACAKMSVAGKARIRTSEELAGMSDRARKNLPKMIALNTGKKRPDHANKMRKLKDQRAPRFPTPFGDLRLTNEYMSPDMISAWCQIPDAVITKSMLSHVRNRDLFPDSWIGKTRREVGFSERYYLPGAFPKT